MTRRKPDRAYHNVYSTFPLFVWRTCFKCGMEFRRERGWRVLTGPYPGGRTIYICGGCASHTIAAMEVAEDSRKAALRMIS